MLKKALSLILIFSLMITTMINPQIAHADTTIPQAGANPIVFNQTATTDNIQYLMAAGSEHNSSLTLNAVEDPKHGYVNNFGKRNANDYLKWSVSLQTGGQYHVWALMNTGLVIPFKLSVGSNELNFSSTGIGWEKVDCGVINIPSGTNTLTFIKNNTNSAAYAEIKSLELIRESDKAAYEARVANFKKSTTSLSNAKYGVMFQYGAWGYPQYGSTRKSLDQGAEDFNVTNFINMVKGTGASYVVWSITWWQYWMQAPITSVDTIMGNGSKTATRDLIGEIAQACEDNGIDFMLYYHNGLQQEADWKAKQNWPSTFATRGVGDKTTFFNNWCNVITEIGNRYGTKLDGWFFDDGPVYYPAPFERLGAAARAGNANRLISYNSYHTARMTDFQDVYFGEIANQSDVANSGSMYGSPTAGSNGVFTAGPYKGTLQHHMFRMEDDWGIHSPNQRNSIEINIQQATSWLTSAKARNVPLTFNMMMWEDGKVSESSLDILHTLKGYMYGKPFYKIKNHADGKMLNGGGRTNGSPVTEWTDVSSTNLLWELIALGNGYYKIKNCTNGKVLSGGGGTNGYAVIEWDNVTSWNLEWELIDQGNGYYKIKNRADGKVLNGGGGTNGSAVTEWDNVSSTNLEWQIIEK